MPVGSTDRADPGRPRPGIASQMSAPSKPGAAAASAPGQPWLPVFQTPVAPGPDPGALPSGQPKTGSSSPHAVQAAGVSPAQAGLQPWSPLQPVRYSIDPATGLPFDPLYRSEHRLAPLGALVPAAFFQRLGALLVDYCILSMMWFSAMVVATLINSATVGLLATFFGPALYFISFWSISGRTPGYRAAGLRLVRTDGSRVSPGVATARYLGSLLSWPFFFLGYLWMLWDPQSQTWHDKIADTTVVQA
jgi:uncharacterized RDD family membrane protein YckC